MPGRRTMRAMQFLRTYTVLIRASLASGAGAQTQQPLCSTYSPIERVLARAAGACVDPAPIVDVVPKGAQPAPKSTEVTPKAEVTPVPVDPAFRVTEPAP